MTTQSLEELADKHCHNYSECFDEYDGESLGFIFTLKQLRALIKDFVQQPCEKCAGVGAWTDNFDSLFSCGGCAGTEINLDEIPL